MTRKDYQLIADAIDAARATIVDTTRPGGDRRAHHLASTQRVVNQLNVALAAENPRFNVPVFTDACLSGPRYQQALEEEGTS